MIASKSPVGHFADLPSPPGHPLVGQLPEWFGKHNAERVLQTLLGYAEQCGPLARIELGPARLLLLSDPEPAAELLNAESANYKGWPYVLTRVVLDNVLLLNGEAWASHRSAYRRALLAADVPSTTAAPLSDFLDRVAREATGNTTVDIADLISELVADCVVELLCGARYDRTLEPHRARVQYELAAVGIDLQCQPWKYFSAYRWVALRRSVAAMRGFFREQVEIRRRQRTEKPDVLSGFEQLAARGEYPDETKALTDAMVNFFFTAHDVLSSSTSWCLHLLAQHPDWQNKVREHAPSSSSTTGALDCVVRESLRLHPGYPLFSRATLKHVEVGGTNIAPGTNVIVSPWVMHRLERHWPNAQSFEPERWADRLEPVAPARKQSARLEPYMPFGGGFRSCIAFAFALPLLQTIVQRFIDRFDIASPEGHVPEIVYHGSTSSSNGLPVYVRTLESARTSSRTDSSAATSSGELA